MHCEKSGEAWRTGPFALCRKLQEAGADLDVALETPSAPLVKISAETTLVGRAHREGRRLTENGSAALHLLGDGIGWLEIRTKMGAIDADIIETIDRAVDAVGGEISSLIIGSGQARAFSVGANLSWLARQIDERRWQEIEAYTRRGQDVFGALRSSPAPVVAILAGHALGGGYEIALHCDQVVAHAEVSVGLPEATVGLVPAWGGARRLLTATKLETAFSTILSGKTFGSAREADAGGLLPGVPGIVMHRSRLDEAAIACVEKIQSGYQAPPSPRFRLGGAAAEAQLIEEQNSRYEEGHLTESELELAVILARMLTGGSERAIETICSEEEVMALECEAFMRAVRRPATRNLIDNLITKGRVGRVSPSN